MMRKLGKKVHGMLETIEAYCDCTCSCTCSCAACSCITTHSAELASTVNNPYYSTSSSTGSNSAGMTSYGSTFGVG